MNKKQIKPPSGGYPSLDFIQKSRIDYLEGQQSRIVSDMIATDERLRHIHRDLRKKISKLYFLAFILSSTLLLVMVGYIYTRNQLNERTDETRQELEDVKSDNLDLAFRIKSLEDRNKAQDVIINKLNTDYQMRNENDSISKY